MAHPFADAPGQLRSLNVARVVVLPGDLASGETIGKRGLDLVSGLAFGREVADRARSLGLDADSPALLRDFGALLGTPRTSSLASATAHDLAAGLGRRLGCLLLMLAQGESANRVARPDWGDAQWGFWAGVRRVVLGGGLVAGAIGDIAVPAAQSILDAHGARAMRLVRSPWGDRIVLVGLARRCRVAAGRRVVLDFGQTSVKIGIADYEGECLARLAVLPTRPGPCPAVVGLSDAREDIEAQWKAMLELAAGTVRNATSQGASVADVVMALACYLRDGQPDPSETRSCYGRLQALAANLTELARTALAVRLGADVDVEILHDGTGAALAVEPGDTTVVVTIGTAIGVGFPLARDARMPLAGGLALESWPAGISGR